MTGARASAGLAPQRVETLVQAAGRSVLDVREDAAFARGHVDGAGRVALAEFATRRNELPERATPVVVVDDEPARAREAAAALVALGYVEVAWLDRALAEEPSGHASRAPAARLWSPGAFVAHNAGRASGARALDLACGSGRAAVYLALAGWQVEGWDVDPSALDRARALATRHAVSVRLEHIDLECEPPAEPATPFALIVVQRYLHRPLFPWIERALAPGGVLLYETFRDGQQRFGPPRRDRHLLRAGELLTAFPALVVEHHEETPDDRPPLLARLVARRPA